MLTEYPRVCRSLRAAAVDAPESLPCVAGGRRAPHRRAARAVSDRPTTLATDILRSTHSHTAQTDRLHSLRPGAGAVWGRRGSVQGSAARRPTPAAAAEGLPAGGCSAPRRALCSRRPGGAPGRPAGSAVQSYGVAPGLPVSESNPHFPLIAQRRKRAGAASRITKRRSRRVCAASGSTKRCSRRVSAEYACHARRN